MSDERERRLAGNEALARDVNEVVDDVAGAWFDPDERLDFRCECARATCTGNVSLSRREYETVRAEPDRFVVLSGHEEAGIEQEVGRIRDYVLVEKRGAGRDVAVETDPRS
jgi:hypothetical protein